MGATIVIGLAILCATVYCDAFKFSGLDPFSNHARQYNGVQNYNVAPSPQPCYNGFHQGSYQKEFPQFGPYPGYQNPVAYSGQGHFSGQAPYPQSSYRFDNPNPFGFAPFPAAPTQNAYNEKNTYNNVPGKYFQEHQFNAHHGSEFSSANVPVEHGIKQYKPKETILNHPVIPFESLFKNFPKPAVIGFIPVGFTKHQVFPQIQTFPQPSLADKSIQNLNRPIIVNQNIGDKFNSVITPVPTNVGETTTLQSVSTNNPSLEVSTEQSLSTEDNLAQKLEQTNSSPSQEEATSITTGSTADVSDNNEVTAAVDTAQDSKQNEDQSNIATNEESNEPNTDRNESVESTTSVNQENASELLKEDSPVSVEDFKETVTNSNNLSTDAPAVESQDNTDESVKINEATAENNIENTSDTQSQGPTENNSEVQNDNKSENSSDQPQTSNDSSQPSSTEKPENDKPADAEVVEQNPVDDDVSSFQNVLTGPVITAADPNVFDEREVSAFNKINNLGAEQPLYIYDPMNLIASNLNTFSSLGGPVQPSVQVLNNGEKIEAVKNDALVTENGMTTENTVILNSSAALSVDGNNNSEKKEVISDAGVISQSPKKSNTVQIVQEGPVFSGQFPALYDPSSNSQLDSFKFFDHPSIKAYAGQASLNSYSPETAFTDFNALFKQGYFIEGAPSLTPEANTANILSIKSATPMSIASKSHPLHAQVFKYSPSHVPYPGLDVKSTEQGARTVDFTAFAEPVVDVKSWLSTSTSASPGSNTKSVKA